MRWKVPVPDSPRSRVWLPVFCALLAGSCWLMSSCSDGVVRRDRDTPTVAWTPPAGATLVGSEVCAGCHEKEAKDSGKSRHGKKADPRTPAAKQDCETCHGPGSVHAQAGGGKGNILAFGKDSPATAAEQSGKCIECHENSSPEWQHGKHASRGVACVDCHSMHSAAPRADHMLKFDTQPELCAQCHKQVWSDLAAQSHHPIREGKVSCSDCHDPHGSTTDKEVKARTVNELCYQCHAEKRGPFLWEHPPVMEDCLVCHVPHGSQHNKLLNAEMPYLCQRCHSNEALYDATSLFRGSNPHAPGFANSCLNCHANIHGSNHPSGQKLIR